MFCLKQIKSTLLLFFVQYLVLCSGKKYIKKLSNDPPPPFNQPGGVTILQGGRIYSPSPIGVFDVVLSDSQILDILTVEETAAFIAGLKSAGILVKQVNATGLYLTPGFIDVHEHAAGAGGEAGPWSRTPEGMLSTIIDGGVTTLVGLLGTDGVTRDLQLLSKK
jgi:beta-aspartyl-dipeptidase (metallo-type)